MKRIGLLLVALGTVAVASTDVLAQTTPPPPRTQGTVQQVEDPKNLGRWRGSKLIGTEVKDAAGKGIGKIEDIIIEPNGRVPMAVMSFGGFLGVGERLYAVPWSAMRIEGDDRDNLVVMLDNVKKETLEKAPSFARDRWPDARDRKWGDESRSYWSDASITASVKTRLAREKAGTLTKVDVDTSKGVVHLTGAVPSSELKKRASEVARSIEGVREVRNDLKVQSGG
ncbi:MAG TPA: BON domain-containing protein [Methylomirabilota bacterium]|jgi:hypothetical protein|nr:BON domain-containing protein [Methylomirabilota bacterium]